jgi:hypothetical protein
VVVDADAFESRLATEKQVLLGKWAPLPITAGLEEVAAFNRSADHESARQGACDSPLISCLMLGVALASFATCGCRDQASAKKTVAAPSRASWLEQVSGVRSGKSRTISIPTASKADWEMLRTGCEPLEVLEIDEELPWGADADVLTALPNLRRLKLHGEFSDAQAATVGGLPKVSELLISSPKLTNEGVISLCRLPLIQLRLETPFGSDAAVLEISKLKQLRFLHLIGFAISDGALQELAKLPSLESFYLDRAICTDEGLSALLKQRPDLHFHRDQVHLPDDPKKHEH